MPKFYRQKKKRIDPRYFLNETINRDLNEEEDLESMKAAYMAKQVERDASIQADIDSDGVKDVDELANLTVKQLQDLLKNIQGNPFFFTGPGSIERTRAAEKRVIAVLSNHPDFDGGTWERQEGDLDGEAWMGGRATEEETEDPTGWTDSQKQASAARQARIAARGHTREEEDKYHRERAEDHRKRWK